MACASPPASEADPTGPPGFVLVVEDEPGIRSALAALVEAEGFEVETAGDGREALEVLRRRPGSCLILLDLMMPGMNGWQFLEECSRDVVLAPVPVVVVSAFEAPRGFRAIRKPIDFNHLVGIVREHCVP
ncbi:response regulator [Myxococcota bacterium]|nr:response regulator [Myxococcota bacterium]